MRIKLQKAHVFCTGAVVILQRYCVEERIMQAVLPVIIICSVGIGGCVAYIAALAVVALRKKTRSGNRRRFEIDENSITVQLGKRNK